jgi:hypothetical protein
VHQICPIDEEHARSRKACNEMMIEWRRQGYNIPLKAHICEHHFCDFSENCGGLEDSDEKIVEQSIPSERENSRCKVQYNINGEEELLCSET